MLGKFYIVEAGLGGRPRGDPAHEGNSSRILRLCTVRWKDARIRRIIQRMGKQTTEVSEHKEIQRIGWNRWRPMEFEWMIFPGHTTLQILHEIQRFMDTLECTLEDFQRRIIFMSMCNDIEWRNEDNKKVPSANSLIVSMHAKRFASSRWSFLGPGSETTWYNSLNVKLGRMQCESDKGQLDMLKQICGGVVILSVPTSLAQLEFLRWRPSRPLPSGLATSAESFLS